MSPDRTTNMPSHKSAPAYVPGHHWVAAANFDPTIQESYAFPNPLTIVDSTLRKIIHISGIRPSIDSMLRIAEALEDVGVREMMLDLHWWGDETPASLQLEICRAVLARKFGFHITVATASLLNAEEVVSMEHVIDTLRDIGMDTLMVSIGDPGNATARKRQSEGLAQVFSYALAGGTACSISIVDFGRMESEYLLTIANEGIRLGATRINLTDSFGSLSPEAMKFLVSRLRRGLSSQVPLTVHVHDDFGLASATAIAAATAGASPDVAVNGVSYRSGFAALEEIALSLELLYGVDTGLRLNRLKGLSDLVAAEIGLPNHVLKSIGGAHAFLIDMPPWVLSYLRGGGGQNVFPPPGVCVAPSVVGARTQVVWGDSSPRPVIRAKLDQMGLHATQTQVLEIQRRIQSGIDAITSYPRWLTEGDVEAICRQVVSGS